MPQDAGRTAIPPGLVGLTGQASVPIDEDAGAVAVFDCQSCGACCSYSADWPRFSTEDDEQLDRIPAELVAADQSGMRCLGVRCVALIGEVGKHTACGIYELRPDVCRACMPGGDDCLMARAAHGLPVS